MATPLSSLTPSLFAHIHNDAYLSGARTLQGQEFSNTIDFLLQYIENSPHKADLKSLSEKINTLKESAIAIKRYKEELGWSSATPEVLMAWIKENKFFQRIAELKPQESVLIAGGWSNEEGGHAMVYEFKNISTTEKPEYAFIIHNTGAGLNYHQKVTSMDKERFSPIKVYQFTLDPEKSTDKDKLAWFLSELIKPQLRNDRRLSYSESSLYEEIFPKVAYLQGELVDPFKHTKQDNLTAGQRSGTCAEKVLHQMCESSLPSKKEYKRFIYGLKRYSLEKYLMQCRLDGTIGSPTIKNQIMLATENMARLLLKSDYFEKGQQEKEHKFLKEIQSELIKPSSEIPVPPAGESLLSSLESSKFSDWDFSKGKESIKSTPNLEQKEEKERKEISDIFVFDLAHITDPNSTIKKLLELSKKNIEAFVEQTELFLVHYVPSDLKQPTEAKTILENLFELKKSYLQQYKAIYGDLVTPQKTLTVLNLIRTASELSKSAQLPDFDQVIGKDIHTTLEKEKNNPYLACEDPKLDKSLLINREYWLNASKNENSLSSCYRNLISKHIKLDHFDSYFYTLSKEEPSKKNAAINAAKMRDFYTFQDYLKSKDKANWVKLFCEACHITDIESTRKAMSDLEADFALTRNLEAQLSELWASISDISEKQFPYSTDFFVTKTNSYSDEYEINIDSWLIKSLKEGRANLINPLVSENWTKADQVSQVLGLSIHSQHHLTPNQIQVDPTLDFYEIQWGGPAKKSLTLPSNRSTLKTKELMHLRSSKTAQIKATLDFFTDHFDYLSDPTYQTYLEKNIFEPGLLISLLDREPQSLEKINAFISRGLDIYTRDNIASQTSAFLLALDIKVNRYAYRHFLSTSKDKKEKKETLEKITRYLENRKTLINDLIKKTKDPAVLHVLHRQNILLIANTIQSLEKETVDPRLFSEYFQSIIYLGHHPTKDPVANKLDNITLEKASSLILNQFKKEYDKNKESCEALLKDVLIGKSSILSASLKAQLADKDLEWYFEFPTLKIRSKSNPPTLSTSSSSAIRRVLTKNSMSQQSTSSMGLSRKPSYFTESPPPLRRRGGLGLRAPLKKFSPAKITPALPSKKPAIPLVSVSLDLRHGQIYQKGLRRDFSPDKLTEDKIFKELFKEKISHVWRNQEGNYFEFDYRSTPYKAFESGRNWVFQRQLSVLKQEPQWYELVTDFSHIVKPQLPEHLTALRFRGWMNGEQLLIEDKQTGKICYCYDNKSKKILQLDQNLEATDYSLLTANSPIHTLFSQFEASTYLEILAKKTDKEDVEEYLVKFSRYNFDVVVKAKQPSGWDIFLANTDYRLDLESPNLISDLGTPLIFVNNKNDKDKIAFMPAQPFIVKNEGDLKESKELSEYFTLTPDIQDQVRKGLFSSAHKRPPQFYNYYDSAHVIRYRIQDNQFMPHSMEDGLYLVYIHLCKRQHEQAFQLLSKLEQQFGSLTGSSKEIEYLQWIVDFLPAKVGEKAAKARISTPEVLATKLKALHLLASFKRDNPNYQLKFKPNPAPNTDDDQYQSDANAQVTALFEKLDERIYQFYREYHHTEENVPNNFKLSALEKLTLLRAYYLKPHSAIGPIAIVWRRLEIQSLEQELRNIASKFKDKTLPRDVLLRKDFIEENLKKHKKIIAHDSSLQSQTIKLSINDNFRYRTEEVSSPDWWNRNLLASIAAQLKTSTSGREIDFNISKLITLPVNVREWIVKFPWLCQAIKQGKEFKERAELIEFCKQTILAARYKTIEGSENITQLSNVEQLASVLYVLLSSPDKFSEKADIDKFFADELRKYSPSIKDKDIQHYFDNLFKEASRCSYSVPPIEYLSQVIKKVDLTDSRKLTSHSLKEKEIKIEKETKVKAEGIPIVIREGLKKEFSIEVVLQSEKKEDTETQQVADYLSEINKIEQECEKALEKLRADFQAIKLDLGFEKQTLEQNKIDEQAGKLIYDINQKKLQLSVEYLGKKAIRKQIYDICESKGKELKKRLEVSLDKLLESANSGYPKDPIEGLKLSGKKKEKLKFNDLLRLYLMGDYAEYRNHTGLDDTQIEILHNDIGVYLWQSQQQQQLDRIREIVDKYPGLGDISATDENAHLINELGAELAAKNQVDPEDRTLTVFQFCQKILIKPQQKIYLESLLKLSDKDHYHNKIIQLIMGGGKTTVLLPTLGLAKANGTNLSMIEVPDHLFRTNFYDLNEKAQRLFGQKVYGFHFKRTPSYTARDYKALYRHLTQAIHSRSYFVTTNSSTTSLFMKYQELLEEGPKAGKEKEWQKQIKWLDRILKIFKERTDVLLDEVHDNLNVRKQYNYTLGEPEAISSFDIKITLDLFKFFAKVEFSKDRTLLDVIKVPSLLLSPEGEKALTTLADALVRSEDSPLKSYIEQLGIKGDKEKEALAGYLLNKNEGFVEQIAKLKDPKARAIFCIYKQQLSNLLTHTLKNKYHENYGRSKNPQKTSLERLIAIPYAGNNEPKEGFQFGNYFVTMNYSIQGVLNEGLDFETTQTLIKKLFEQANLELIENPSLDSLVATQAGILLQKFLKRFPNQVNLEDKEQLEDLYQSLKNDPDFIFYALEEEILPQITVNRKVLFSNLQHHVSMFHSVQGMTGTPWNSHTQNLDFDALPSLGTDGFTTNLLKVKKAPVNPLRYQNPNQFLGDAFKTMSSTDVRKTRAIIDIGAMFRGISNRKAAESIADYCGENVSQLGTIKYVLFFDKNKLNDQDELFALSTDGTHRVIHLGSSRPENIQAKLGCSPEERLTYYDQRNTVGNDVLQSRSAKALATVDDKTLYKDLIQGSMRMRELAGAQSINFFVDPETAKLMSKGASITIEDVIQLTRDNQNTQLLNDHFKADIEKMDNVIRQNLFEAILSVSDKDANQKRAYLLAFQSFFIQNIDVDLFKLYGAVGKPQETLKILKDHQAQLLSQWKKVRAKAGLVITELEEKEIGELLDKIVIEAEKYCAKLSLHQEAIALDQETQTETEKEQEKEQEQELEQEKEQESEKTAYKAQVTQKWFSALDYKTLMDKSFNALEYSGASSTEKLVLKSKSLTELLQERFPERHFVWHPNLYASPNFYLSSDLDKTYFGQHQKPVHMVLMRQTQKGLDAMIITYEELEGLKDLLGDKANGINDEYLWVINTQGSVLNGKAPGSPSKEYNLILQQLRFFNGDYLRLAEQDTELSWLLENTQEKLEVFGQHVFPYRLGEKRQLNNLKQRLHAIHAATAFIISEDSFFPENIKERFPGLKDSDIASIKAFNDFLIKVRREGNDITEIEQIKYGSPFYFKLILRNKEEGLIKNYLKALDSKALSEQIQLLLREASGEGDLEVLNIILPILSQSSIKIENLNQILLEPVFIKASTLSQDSRSKVIEQFKEILKFRGCFDKETRLSFLRDAGLCFARYPCSFDRVLLNTFFDSISETELQTLFLDKSYFRSFMSNLMQSANREGIKLILSKIDKKFVEDYLMQESVMQDIIFKGSEEFLESLIAIIEPKKLEEALKSMVLDVNSFNHLKNHSEAEKFYLRLRKIPNLLQKIQEILREKPTICEAFWIKIIKTQHRSLLFLANESFGAKNLIELLVRKKNLFFEAIHPDSEPEFLMELFSLIESASIKVDLLNFKKDGIDIFKVFNSNSDKQKPRHYYYLLKAKYELNLQLSMQALDEAQDGSSERKNLIDILNDLPSYFLEISRIRTNQTHGLDKLHDLRISLSKDTQITPLMIAAKEGSEDVLYSLMVRGYGFVSSTLTESERIKIERYLTDKDSQGKTMIDYALQNENEAEKIKIIQFLFQRCKIQGQSEYGFSSSTDGVLIDINKILNKENFGSVLAIAFLKKEGFILERILQTKHGQEYLTSQDVQRDYIKHQRLAEVFDKSGFKLDFSYLKNQTDEDSLNYFDSYFMSLVRNKSLNVTEIQGLLNSHIGQAYLSSQYLKKNLYTVLHTYNEQVTRLFLQKELTPPLIKYIIFHLVIELSIPKEHLGQKKFLEDKLGEFFKISVKEGQETIAQLISDGIQKSKWSSMPSEYELIKLLCTNNRALITNEHIQTVTGSDNAFCKNLQTLFTELSSVKDQEKDKEKEKSFLPGYEAVKDGSSSVDSNEEPKTLDLTKTSRPPTSKKE